MNVKSMTKECNGHESAPMRYYKFALPRKVKNGKVTGLLFKIGFTKKPVRSINKMDPSESPQWNKVGKGIGVGTAAFTVAEATDHYAAGRAFDGNQKVFSFSAAMAGGAGAAKFAPVPAKPFLFATGAILSGLGADKLYELVVPPPLEKVYGLYPYDSATAPVEYAKSYIAPMPPIKAPALPPEPQKYWNSLSEYKKSLN